MAEHQPLRWEDGTRSAAEGKDLAAVARTLTLEELDYLGRMKSAGGMPHEESILQAEIDRRDPKGTRGTLWQFVEEEPKP